MPIAWPVYWGPLVYLFSWGILRAIARYLYFSLTPGIPEIGSAPVAVIPWLFWKYNRAGISLLTDSALFLVWLVACLVYVLPALLAAGLSGNRADNRQLLWAMGVVGIVSEWLVVRYRFALVDSGIIAPHSLSVFLEPALWWVGLTLLGWAGGRWIAAKWPGKKSAFARKYTSSSI
ncbi:MAG: hypothetical protein GXO78_07920 [Calditrichaeota bacterium]|nr:hypothetical protein [Calditrichota bacterium]